MSQLNLTSTVPAVGRLDTDTLIRSILLAAVLLVLWISFHPFQSLTDPPEVTEAGTLANQVGYPLLFVVLATWCARHEPARLILLLRPVLIGVLLWSALSVATSWDPPLSARRFAFDLTTIGIAGMAILLPRNVRHFSGVLAVVALVVLALCYFGVFFAPSVSVHQAGDFLEPEIAGDWRGVFGHKNEASAAMVTFVFIGLFVGRVRSVFIGGLICVLALMFLLFTHSKTSIALLPVALAISAVMARTRKPTFGIALALSVVGGLFVMSVGSLFFEPIRNLVDAILSDSSFTGRTEVWQFVLDHVKERPITGFGFAAFWGTPEVVYGMGDSSNWANNAGHAHNAYLNLALTIGIPGAILFTLWLVVLPLVDFYRAPRDRSAVALELLFLRVCLFAALASCFENMLLREGGSALFLLAAVFGLRLLSVARLAS